MPRYDPLRAERLDRSADRRGRVRVPAGIRRRLLKTVRGLRVYLVDGARIRSEIDIDFTMGGTGARYGYVPMDEVWIDEALAAGIDRDATLLHEMVERDLMLRRGMTYEKAHDIASAAEMRLRRRCR